MNTTIPLRVMPVSQFAVTCVVLAGLGFVPLQGGDAGEAPGEIAEKLRQLRTRIEEQGKQIDRLYRALGPHLTVLEEQTA